MVLEQKKRIWKDATPKGVSGNAMVSIKEDGSIKAFIEPEAPDKDSSN